MKLKFIEKIENENPLDWMASYAMPLENWMAVDFLERFAMITEVLANPNIGTIDWECVPRIYIYVAGFDPEDTDSESWGHFWILIKEKNNGYTHRLRCIVESS